MPSGVLEEWDLINIKESYPALWELLRRLYPGGKCTTTELYDGIAWLWSITDVTKANPHIQRMIRFGFLERPTEGHIIICQDPEIMKATKGPEPDGDRDA